MNELFTTTLTVSVGEIIAALKLAFPTNLRLKAMPVGGAGISADMHGPNGLTIKWTRDARQLGAE